MSKFISVFIEIEKNSNLKFEFDKNTNNLLLDRILKYPYFYPYSYGFIPNTLAEDNDELDIIIVSENNFKSGSLIQVYIIGALLMEDEKGPDPKIIAISREDYLKKNIQDIFELDDEILKNCEWFFSNYKTKDLDKWSKIIKFVNRKEANNLFLKSVQNFLIDKKFEDIPL